MAALATAAAYRGYSNSNYGSIPSNSRQSFNRSNADFARGENNGFANRGFEGNGRHHNDYFNGNGENGWNSYGGYGGWGFGWGGYLPWIGWGGYGGYPYDDYYYSYYPDNDSYNYSYAPAETTAPLQPIPTTASVASTPNENSQVASDGSAYYGQARESFAEGNYKEALRLASHAAVDAPNNPRVHELISQSLFALGNYDAAASEAHVAGVMGPIATWTELYGYYNNVDTYSTQLRALEKGFTRKGELGC